MKKWMKISLAVAILAVISAFLVYKYVYNKQHPDFEHLKPEATLSASDLFTQFRQNPAAASTLYNGKVLAITGKLSRVESADSLVIAVFVFGTGDFGDEGVRCTMLKNHSAEALRFQPDGEVSLKGYCTGYNETDVILEKCSIIQQ